MCPFINNLNDFDRVRARRRYEKQRRNAAQFGSDYSTGPRHKRRDQDYSDYEDYEEYDDFDDYDDYNEDEFDSYARIHHPY